MFKNIEQTNMPYIQIVQTSQAQITYSQQIFDSIVSNRKFLLEIFYKCNMKVLIWMTSNFFARQKY